MVKFKVLIGSKSSLDAAQRNQGSCGATLDYAALHQGYFPNKKPSFYSYAALCLILFLSMCTAHAQEQDHELMTDIQAYCQYIETKNKAQTSILLSPDVIVRAQKPTRNATQSLSSDNLNQNNLIIALSKDLADFGRAKEMKQLLHNECHYYQLSQLAKLQIEFALPNAQREALGFKLKYLHHAKNKIRHLSELMQQKIKQKNDTLISLYKLDLAQQKLDDEERRIQIKLAIAQPAQLKTTSLKHLLHEIREADRARQNTKASLAKLRNWSLQIQAGAQQDSASFLQSQATQPYAAVFVRYNLATLYSNQQSDQSVAHYANWKTKQLNGTQKKLARLMLSITQIKTAAAEKLRHLRNKYHKYHQLTHTLQAVDSEKASHFNQDIEIDQIMTKIEINYLNYFIDQLNELVG